MAYISKNPISGKWGGPYPHKAGDFIGNVKVDEVSDEQRRNFRIGDPSSCKTGDSSQLKQNGYAGLYLKHDKATVVGSYVEVDTDVLQEDVVTGKRAPLKPFKSPYHIESR